MEEVKPNEDVIAKTVEAIQEDYKQEQEQPKKRRGRRTKEEIEAEKAKVNAEAIQISAMAIGMLTLAITRFLEENVSNWDKASEEERRALAEALHTWLKVRAAWFALFAPEIALLSAWGGYIIPRMVNKKKVDEKKKQTTQTQDKVIPIVETENATGVAT